MSTASGETNHTEVTVQSWAELNERLYEGSWQDSLSRFRAPWIYRGMTDAQATLPTSLIRLGGAEAAPALEGHLLRAFCRYASRELAGDNGIWNVLALAQHHGLPTRLLDWTYSPLVALHFVTAEPDGFERDGVVWCLDFGRTNALLPPSLRHLLDREGAQIFTADLLGEAAADLERFAQLSPEPFAVLFEPPSLDARIINQFALFSLLSHADIAFDAWLERHAPDACRRVIIPASLKYEVRDKLDQANITERVLLPGLDGLCTWLTRYYRPRHP